MTPEQLTQLNKLQETVDNISRSSTIPRDIETALSERLGLSKGLSGTKIYYVSDTSGGAVTRMLTFTNGILTSES